MAIRAYSADQIYAFNVLSNASSSQEKRSLASNNTRFRPRLNIGTLRGSCSSQIVFVFVSPLT